MDTLSLGSHTTLGIFAPASPFPQERFARGVEILKELGFGLRLHPALQEKDGYLAGSDETRTEALHDLLADNEVDALMAARGGYGVHRILERVQPDLIQRAKKPIVGFSDLTALHALIQGHASLPSVHGPVVTQLTDLSKEDHQQLRQCLQGAAQLSYSADGPVIHSGKAQGPLFGGCLSVLVALLGTPWFYAPPGGILLLEDVGEAPYRIDRMLTQLHLSGVLSRVAGIALGDFVGCRAPRAGEPDVAQVLSERLSLLGIPVLAGLPFGHGKRNRAVFLGREVRLDTDARLLSQVHT